MATGDQSKRYRHYASECLRLAQLAPGSQKKDLLLQMAAGWRGGKTPTLDPGLIETTVGAAMDGPFPTIASGAHIDEAFNALLGGATALVVMDAQQPVGIITRLDLLEFMARRRARR